MTYEDGYTIGQQDGTTQGTTDGNAGVYVPTVVDFEVIPGSYEDGYVQGYNLNYTNAWDTATAV